MIKMKRLSSTLLLIAVCIIAHAYDFTDGTLAYNILSTTDKTVEIADFVNSAARRQDNYHLIIPETVEYNGTTYTVTAIAEKSLITISAEEITIPATITKIQLPAFYYGESSAKLNITDLEAWCRTKIDINLDDYESIVEDETITLMGYSDMYLNGVKIQDLKIPESITEINPFTFYECKSLKSVTMSDKVTSIGRYAFGKCTNLTSITLSENLKDIGDKALCKASSLREISLPKSLENFGERVFQNNSLSKIEVESGCTNYDSRNNCNAVIDSKTNILLAGCLNTKIPEDVVALDDYSFYGCRSLTKLDIPHSVQRIGAHALEKCSSLQSISLTNNIKEIVAFQVPDNLKEVNMNFVDKADLCHYMSRDDIESVFFPQYFYENTMEAQSRHMYINGELVTEIKDIPDSLTAISNHAFYNCGDLKNVELGKNMKTLGCSAFAKCTQLATITISPSLESSDDACFLDCSALKRVDISDLQAWCNIAFATNTLLYDNQVFSNPLCNGADLYLNGEKLTDLVVPDGMTKLGVGQFYNCKSINTVTFPSSMADVGVSAFQYCSNLKTINFSPAMSKINKYCFFGCGITSLTLPKHIVELDDYAFGYCKNLTTVDTGEGVTTLHDYIFDSCSKLTTITLGSATQELGTNIDGYISNVTSVILRATTIPTTGIYPFSSYNYDKTILYVPAKSLSAYKKASPWYYLFLDIKPISDTGIEGVTIDASDANGNGAAPCYDLEGRRISGTPHGLVIQQGKKMLLSK